MVADLSIREALSFVLGGVIGGGIFAVLGVVDVAGPSAWLAYLLAGIAAHSLDRAHLTTSTRSDRTHSDSVVETGVYKRAARCLKRGS